MSKIYLERDMDYYIYDTVEEVNAKAAELIVADKYDFIAVYNGNYDAIMHKYGPESMEAISELRANARTFVSLFRPCHLGQINHTLSTRKDRSTAGLSAYYIFIIIVHRIFHNSSSGIRLMASSMIPCSTAATNCASVNHSRCSRDSG